MIEKMNKIINYLFPKKSQWFDVGCCETHGKYRLIQMRYNLENNKKYFRIADIGFINDYVSKGNIFNNILTINSITNAN